MTCTDCGKEVEIKKKEGGVSTWRCTCGAYGIYGKRSKRDGGTEAQAGAAGTGQEAAAETAPANNDALRGEASQPPADPDPAGAGTELGNAAVTEPDRGSEKPWYDTSLADLLDDLIG